MSNRISREIRLKQRPTGLPAAEHFELAETELPAPKSGEVLVRNIWMTVDPYMRGRMRDVESYVPPFQIGEPLQGGAIGQVVESESDTLAVGDYVNSMLGWREGFVSSPEGLTKVDPALAPVQTFLGTLGMPGITAYFGLLDIGEPKEGETVFVSAAAGAVGAIVCQIAKLKGCRVVGTAGSDAKVDWLVQSAGADAAINYKTCGNLTEALREACPQGIDVYFENVGGDHLEAALMLMNPRGRISVCGMISQYNAEQMPAGPTNFIQVIPKRLRIEGFIVSDYLDRVGEFYQDMGKWIGEGKIKWEETIHEGIENAPNAFINLFSGENMGKMLVKVGPDPAI